jgi:hypothetical protein
MFGRNSSFVIYLTQREPRNCAQYVSFVFKTLKYWPPQDYNYHALGSHYFMMFKEFYESHLLDYPDSTNRNTIMKHPDLVHEEWVKSIEKKKKTHHHVKYYYILLYFIFLFLIFFIFRNYLKSKKETYLGNDNRDLNN